MGEWGRVVIMLSLAIAASAALLALLWQFGWLSMAHKRRVVRRELVAAYRVLAGFAVFLILLFAYPPPTADKVSSAIALMIVFAACMAMVWYLSSRTDEWVNGPRVGERMNSEILFEEVGDDDDDEDGTIYGWSVQPVVDDKLRQSQRDTHSGGAVQGSAGEVRQPVSASESGRTGSAGGSASCISRGESASADRSGASELADGNRARTRGDGERNGVVVYPAVAPTNRSGRGRRLAGALVPRQSASNDGASQGGYDARSAAVSATIAGAGAQSGN